MIKTHCLPNFCKKNKKKLARCKKNIIHKYTLKHTINKDTGKITTKRTNIFLKLRKDGQRTLKVANISGPGKHFSCYVRSSGHLE